MSFEVRRGISMLALETHIRRIRLEQNIDPDQLQSFFYDFYQFLSGGNHDAIIRFLYLLPRHKGGLSLLGNALFSNNKKIVEYAVGCLKKIEESPIGKKYISQINFVARTKYISACQDE